MVAIMRDITERIEREKALRESEAGLDMALKGADLGTWDFFIKENRIIHNRRWGEMLGYHFEITSVNEQFWEKFVHPADIESSYRKFQDHINGLTPFYEANLRMLASNGEWRWILDKGRVVEWDENGEPVRASGIHRDITALKSIEKEIEDQRIFLQQIIKMPYQTPSMCVMQAMNLWSSTMPLLNTRVLTGRWSCSINSTGTISFMKHFSN